MVSRQQTLVLSLPSVKIGARNLRNQNTFFFFFIYIFDNTTERDEFFVVLLDTLAISIVFIGS